jgi:hypothetical protein
MDLIRRGEVMTMPETPSVEEVARRTLAMDTAVTILSLHVPDRSGACKGCAEAWGRWVAYDDCAHLVWARDVIETHAAADGFHRVPKAKIYAIAS